MLLEVSPRLKSTLAGFDDAPTFSRWLGDALAGVGVGVCEVDDDGLIRWLSAVAAEHLGTDAGLARGAALDDVSFNACGGAAPRARVTRATARLAFVVAARDEAGQRRLENLGRMTTAIAHDFNNLLSVIWSFSDGLAAEPSLTLAQRADAFEIRATAMRAAGLSQQLLAAGRPVRAHARAVDCAATFASMERLLSALIGSGVDLSWHVERGTPACAITPTQFEQVIVNLAVNAGLAMSSRGTLGLLARRVVEGGEPMVCVEVRDTGGGIAPEVLPHIFEPFFTTRAAGKGLGVGLSTVRKLVRDAGGEVTVASTGATGTVFSVLLPVALDGELEVPAPELELAPVSLGAGQRLLVVEPEHAVRGLLYALLSRAGYHVTLASNGAEALFLFNEAQRPFDGLLTATDLPFLGGVELARRVGAGTRALPVLLVHPSDQLPAPTTFTAHCLGKPFSERKLLAQVAGLFREEGAPPTGAS